MNILICSSVDFGGCGFRLAEAVNKCTEHEARHLTLKGHGFSYPRDIVSGKLSTIRHYVEWADVVNCFICGSGIGVLKKAGFRPDSGLKLIMTYVGTPYWRRPSKCHKLAEEWDVKLQIALGSRLTEMGENNHLLPIALPVDDWRYVRRKWRGWVKRCRAKGALISPIVMQTPSSPRKKKTAQIRAALGERLDIDFRVVRGSHKRVLRAKAQADIGIGLFDKMPYGLSGLEFMAMGIPLIAHTDAHGEAVLIKHFNVLPYYDRPLAELSDAVTELLKDPDLCHGYGEIGADYVRRYHDYPVVAAKFIRLIEEHVL